MFKDSHDEFLSHKRQKQHATDVHYVSNSNIITVVTDFNFYIPQEPLLNPEIPKNDPVISDNLHNLNNLHDVSHDRGQDQFVTVTLKQIKDYEKIAVDCIVFEQKLKDYEKIVNEMQQIEKKNQSVSHIK